MKARWSLLAELADEWRARRARPQHRAPRPPRRPGDLPRVLAAARTGALWLAALLVAASTAVALAESYRALYVWASTHLVLGIWAGAWPLMIDTFIVIGEIGLFCATLGAWDWRARSYWWVIVLGGLAASVAGNVGHIQTHMVTDRLTAAVPPLAAFISLTVGVGILKRVLLVDHGRRGETLADVLDGLDPRGVVDTLTDLGVTDTGILAAAAGRSVRQVRRYRANGNGHEPDSRGADVRTMSPRRWHPYPLPGEDGA